jgi:hypothetical protein
LVVAASVFAAAEFLHQIGVVAGTFHWKLMVEVAVCTIFGLPDLQLKAADWTALV